MDSRAYQYAVDGIETLESTQLEELVTSDYDLSIFTCTPGGQRRVVVRCILQSVDGIAV